MLEGAKTKMLVDDAAIEAVQLQQHELDEMEFKKEEANNEEAEITTLNTHSND